MDFLRLGQNPIIIKCTQTMCKKDETHVTYLHKKPHQIHPDTCSYSRQHRPCIRLHVDTDCSNIRRCQLVKRYENKKYHCAKFRFAMILYAVVQIIMNANSNESN